MHNSALQVLKKITNHGYKAFIVGGYPRDLYIGIKSVDIDICTNATPKDLSLIFEHLTIPSKEYGAVSFVYNKIRFEITTFRKEIKYDNNRLPVKIRYIDDLIADLKRRDFTINTMCIDENDILLDFLGGKEDINSKVIKMVGDPKKRLKEDALRILRAIRFATILDFELDKELKKWIIKYGYLLKKLSYFRKKEELDKIFSSHNAQKGIDLLKDLRLDKYLDVDLSNITLTTSLIGVWSQTNTLNIYDFTSNEKDMIIKINELMNKELNNYNLYKYGLYICGVVSEIKGLDKKETTKKYNLLPIYSKKDIEISALEICTILNKKAGSFLKDIFNDLEEEILSGNIENKKEYLKKYIKKYK